MCVTTYTATLHHAVHAVQRFYAHLRHSAGVRRSRFQADMQCRWNAHFIRIVVCAQKRSTQPSQNDETSKSTRHNDMMRCHRRRTQQKTTNSQQAEHTQFYILYSAQRAPRQYYVPRCSRICHGRRLNCVYTHTHTHHSYRMQWLSPILSFMPHLWRIWIFKPVFAGWSTSPLQQRCTFLWADGECVWWARNVESCCSLF